MNLWDLYWNGMLWTAIGILAICVIVVVVSMLQLFMRLFSKNRRKEDSSSMPSMGEPGDDEAALILLAVIGCVLWPLLWVVAVIVILIGFGWVLYQIFKSLKKVA